MALKPVGGKYDGVWANELKNGDISYYINYRDEHNKPKKVQVGKKTLISDFTAKDAYSKLIEIKYKLQHDQAPVVKGTRVSKVKLDDLWDKYLVWAKANKKTWKDDLVRYEKHIKPKLGNRVAKTLKPIDFESLKEELFDKNLSASTVKHCLAIARQIYNYAIKNDFLINFTNPIGSGRVNMPALDNARLAFLTKEQATQLLDITKATNKNTYFLISFLLFTGARFSEVATLTWSDVNFHTNTLFFKKNKRGNERHIFITDQLLEILHTLKDIAQEKNSDLVISKHNGKLYETMPRYFNSAIEAVIPGNDEKESKHKIIAHSLRHTHASWLAMDGLDILQIKEQLGHKTIEMTMRYAHLTPSRRHEATKALIL